MPHVCPLHPEEELELREADTRWGNWAYFKCPLRGCYVCCGAHQVDTYVPAVTEQLQPFFRRLPLTKMKCFCSNNLNLTMSNSERNPGRLFFKCAKRECDFFQWADEDPRKNTKRWLEGEKFMTLFSGQVVKRKPQDVLWETPLQKGVREIVDKHMGLPPDTTPQSRYIPQGNNWSIVQENPGKKLHTIVAETVTPKERAVLEKRGMGPYEGNWHPDDMKKPDVQDMVRREVEWYMSK